MKYRPSNGTEGLTFFEFFCSKCIHDINEDCRIIADTMAFDLNDPEYPNEWQIIDDKALCTKFHDKDIPLPEPIDPNQLTIFEEQHNDN